jgi:hypothetical protein
MIPKTKTSDDWMQNLSVADTHGVKKMVEKRSEASLVKQSFNRNSLHFALPIIFLCPSLGSLTWPMCDIRQGTEPKVIEPGHARGKSNNKPRSDGFAAAGLSR